jgi:hypothetical protein
MGHVLFVLIGIVAAAVPALAADTTYRDPHQPPFTLLVPNGWMAERTEQDVTLRRGDSFFLLRVLGEARVTGVVIELSNNGGTAKVDSASPVDLKKTAESHSRSVLATLSRENNGAFPC